MQYFVILLFLIVSCIFELLGCYFIWVAIKDTRSIYTGILGTFFLILYAVLPTIYGTDFGKSYIIYGCVFVLVVIFWTHLTEKDVLDKYDMIASILVLVATLLYWFPRKL